MNVGRQKGATVLERVSVGDVMIEKDTGVLYLPVKRQPVLGVNRHSQAEAVEQVKIVCTLEADAYRAFETITVFAANVKPGRQNFVEFRDRKQPRRMV